jgi:hypothetical protein
LFADLDINRKRKPMPPRGFKNPINQPA